MKLQKISDIELYFTEYDYLQLFSKSFPFTELGRIYELLPLKEMAASSQLPKKHPQGNTQMFPPEGKNEPKTVSTARRIIGNLRTTVMEGSFGIHIANAATLAARQQASETDRKEKKTNVTQNFSISSLSFQIETDSSYLILQNSAILNSREIYICILNQFFQSFSNLRLLTDIF